MTKILFKGKKASDDQWLIGKSFDQDTFSNYFVDDERVYKDSVGLFTGLYDANGDPVFGGDILRVNASTLDIDVVIVWNQNEAKWQADRVIGGKFSDLTTAKLDHWQLIGNMFDRIQK